MDSVLVIFKRKKHNELCHSAHLKAHKHIGFKVAGAPDNPFQAQTAKSKAGSTAQTKTTTTNVQTPEEDDVQETIPSTSATEDSEETATTPTKNRNEKERDNSDDECEFSDNSDDELITEVDWVQCAGQMGSLICQMADLKKNIERCIVPNHKNFLIDAKEAAISCKKMAIRLQNSVDLDLAKYNEGEVPVAESDLPDPVSKDPGLRPLITTKRQRLYLAQIGPQQPKLFNYPPNEDITSSSKQNRFTAVWFSQYPFLEYSTEKDAAFCFVCQMFPKGIDRERSTQNWCSTGVRKWDKMKSRGAGNPGKLSEHFSSKAHNAAFLDYVHFMSNNSQSHVDSLLDTEVRAKAVQLQEDKENNRAIIKLIIDLCRTMARQGISFRGTQSDADSNFVQLLSFTSKHYPKLKQWMDNKHNRAYKVTYTSPQSQNEFLSLLDHDGAVHERLLDLKEVREKTGEDQAIAIIQSVDQNGLDNKSISFQSYDFTNSMSGKYNGAQAVVSWLLDREVPYIPCQGHRSNTVNEHACEASPIVSELFDTLQATYSFFSGSTKRYAVLHDVLQNVENSLILRNLSLTCTRWTARAESLRPMWISYEAVIEVLRKISNDGSVDAKGKAAATSLLAKVLRVDFVISLMFMENKVKSLQDIRKDDEGIANHDQIQASTDVLSVKDVDAAGEFAKLHRPRSRPRRLDDNPESAAEISMMNFYDREFKEVLDILIAQYKDNINASLEKVKALFIVLQPPLSSHHEEKDVKDLLNLFSLQAPDQAAFTAEFEVFVNVVMNEGNTNPIQSLADAAKEAEKRKHIFPLTSQVYRLALTSPVTVVGNERIERTFSKLKTVKTALRNSMSDHRLQNLILLNSEKDITDSVDLDILVEKWFMKTNRRINL
ncbi:zinc finger MYM-type 1-like [Paramuricea clavata]|uniref:Zinc finger MYM-type 1-like n=1 Tax=Paramuricea clavata TaxID=317549 RepID=A0A7D9HZP9_PARCT|nr:zinc finger MYM-type 1-like [Paramuricea clavata]